MLEELQSVIQNYEDATNSHDFDIVEKMLTEDAVYYFSDGTYRGIAELRQVFERTWAAIPDEVYRIVDVEWISVSEHSAACIYQYRWQGTYQGKKAEGGGRGTNALVKKDGRWLICHEHLSALPSAKA